MGRDSGSMRVLTLVLVTAVVAALAVGTGVLWSKGSLNELIKKWFPDAELF